jgi:cardiolipin synthase
MVTVEGPATRDAIAAFNRNWTRTGADAIPLPHYPAGASPKAKVILNDPESDVFDLTKTFLDEIGNAKKSVKVMMPYLSDEPFIEALSKARARGVEVNVMLPRLNDEKVYVDLNNHFAESLLDNGINVRWYEGKVTPDLPKEHFSHTKLMVIDDQKSIFGSANADTRAFKANHELSVLIDDENFAKDVHKRLWSPDWEASPEASLAALDDVGIGEKLKRKAWGAIAPLI